MAELYIYNSKVESVFQLLGDKENDISYSVGYAFANCREFLMNFLKHLNLNVAVDLNLIKVLLQSHEKDKGFTDFELIQNNDFHIIIEAKRGWVFPSENQLQKYATRISFVESSAKEKRIIVFNESIPAFTASHFNFRNINTVPIDVISWQDLQKIAQRSKKTGRDAENRLLKELNHYLIQISTMQKKDSNLVYVVSLGSGTPQGWGISWQNIVNKHLKYFHPVGGTKSGWPAEPPNYIAFRYGGVLQSIHHIDGYEVFTDPHLHFNEIPSGNWGNHYLYRLGPAIKPNHIVRSGKKIIRSMRVWAMLDLLLTCQTIEEARDKTKLR